MYIFISKVREIHKSHQQGGDHAPSHQQGVDQLGEGNTQVPPTRWGQRTFSSTRWGSVRRGKCTSPTNKVGTTHLLINKVSTTHSHSSLSQTRQESPERSPESYLNNDTSLQDIMLTILRTVTFGGISAGSFLALLTVSVKLRECTSCIRVNYADIRRRPGWAFAALSQFLDPPQAWTAVQYILPCILCPSTLSLIAPFSCHFSYPSLYRIYLITILCSVSSFFLLLH